MRERGAGLALLAASNAPFTRAFGTQNGAHVTVTVNAARASTAELAATSRLAGVTAAAGMGRVRAALRALAFTDPSPAPGAGRWFAQHALPAAELSLHASAARRFDVSWVARMAESHAPNSLRA